MLTEQYIDNLAQNMEAVVPAPSPYRLFLKWIIGSFLYIAVGLIFMGVRPDCVHKLQSPLFTAELAALGGVIFTSMLSAALLAFPDIYQKKRAAFLPIPMFLLFMFILILAFHADNPPAPPPPHAMECLLCIILLSLLPCGFILYTIRKFASTHYYMAGCVAVLSAFSIGALALRLSEETDSIAHIVQWHYLPMIGAGIIGILLGKLCLKW